MLVVETNAGKPVYASQSPKNITAFLRNQIGGDNLHLYRVKGYVGLWSSHQTSTDWLEGRGRDSLHYFEDDPAEWAELGYGGEYNKPRYTATSGGAYSLVGFENDAGRTAAEQLVHDNQQEDSEDEGPVLAPENPPDNVPDEGEEDGG